jgi:uncharacterized membrane protein YedE/YeeE
MEWLKNPWPWYVAGPIIGITVPTLLLLGNKSLGISSTLRQICAACFPAGIPFLQYNWKKDSWNLYFAAGILIGGFIGGKLLSNPSAVQVSEDTLALFKRWEIYHADGLLPTDIFQWSELFTSRGFVLVVVGGFLVGFGTRYAGGCTSGHGIFGLATFQWPSLIATLCFFVGGIVVSHFILPLILAL